MRVGVLGIASLGVGMALLCLCGCVNCGLFGDSDYASQDDLPRLEAVVSDVERNAAAMRFSRVAKSLAGVGVFLATGEYDAVVPTKPLDAFWDALPNNGTRRIHKSYRATHSLMGCRRVLARDLIEFINGK